MVVTILIFISALMAGRRMVISIVNKIIMTRLA